MAQSDTLFQYWNFIAGYLIALIGRKSQYSGLAQSHNQYGSEREQDRIGNWLQDIVSGLEPFLVLAQIQSGISDTD